MCAAVPPTIVVLMALPGVAPLWFRLVQLACAVPIAVAGTMVNRRALRRAYPGGAVERSGEVPPVRA